MSRTIGLIVHSSIQPFHRFKILLDKKKNVSYLEVFQQIVGFILHLICFKQYSVLIIAQIIYLVGGVPPSGGVTRKRRPPAPKSAISQPANVMLQKCSSATWPLETGFIDKDKRAKISRLVIGVTSYLLAVRCL